MTAKKFYAGIGSCETPKDILKIAKDFDVPIYNLALAGDIQMLNKKVLENE